MKAVRFHSIVKGVNIEQSPVRNMEKPKQLIPPRLFEITTPIGDVKYPQK